MTEPMSDERLARLATDNEPVGDHLSGLTADEVAELVAEVKRLCAVNAADADAYEVGLLQIHADRDHWQQRSVDEWERADAAEIKLAESLDALTVAAELIDRLAFDDECDYDHHAYCQAHNLHEHPCPHPLGRQFVEAWRVVESEEKKAADDGHE